MADISNVTVDNVNYSFKDASAPARPLGDGYSKTGTLPISSTDTISEAIGKLENNIGSGGGGAVNTVYIGATQYPPDSNGKVTLPAYPTTLPANGGTASNVSGTVAIAHGGTGATSASSARSNLGLGSAATKSSTTSVTSGSSSLVTSGGVYNALSPCQTFLDSGPKNKLDTSLSALKAVNTSGTWNGNVYTVDTGTVTVNTDGTITVKKTSTSNRLLFYLSSNNSSSAISGTKYAGYIFSGTPQGGSSNTYGMNGEQAGSPWGSICVDLGSGATIQSSSVSVYFYISLKATYTTSSSGLIFKPMICSEEAFNVSTKFMPYKTDFIAESLKPWALLKSGDNLDNLVNAMESRGVYFMFALGTADVLNKPANGIFCVRTTSYGGGTALQEVTILTGNDRGKSYVRTFINNSDWSAWKEITNT